MKKYVFEYYAEMEPNQSAEDRGEAMKRTTAWFASLGSKLVDGGNPFAPGGMAVEKTGVSKIENHPAAGYSIVNAESMDEAVAMAKTCPILERSAAAVRVYEALPM